MLRPRLCRGHVCLSVTALLTESGLRSG
ncbi:hypothetical protein Mp_1g00030 [Marchantia polymorpha subsp. ruderalis]|uniref:Uncharacterized protein n=1 Tax=Marchantia polymorpha subsp. ruderalis TaxID=1480154 RepID=A0AAF6AJT4_MARPO|nr:hypothetical protein Mp_1g00030 [Marchantia polymorpha subsp. ruderalis]